MFGKKYTKKRKSSHLLIWAFAIFIANSISAQDFHYSQFFNAPLQLNPALTGVFSGDLRLMGNYRNQWRSVPVDYNTFTLAADKKFVRRTDKLGFFAAGIHIDYDQAGDSRLQLIDLSLNGSYTHALKKNYFLSFGAAGRIAQRSFELEELTFDNQFGEGIFDPNLPINENFDATSHLSADASLGVNLRWQNQDGTALVDRLEKRSKVDIGVGVYHLLQPAQAFYDNDDAQLPIRFSPYVMANLQIAKELDIAINMTPQFQGSYKELVGLLGLKVHLNRKLGKQLALQFDIGYRHNDFSDAFYPGVEVFYNSWHVGFTYDVNISPFKIASNRYGGPELSIKYIIKKVRPLPQFKVCPLI